ncbi:RnfH family protein [Roseateles sp. BYS180W]|uniref:UPF0125 protein ACG0Z6_15070 n=1 Tax=Roseateles rivi TaxID=3299028 RepID=A0ABW7FYX3_9BURK
MAHAEEATAVAVEVLNIELLWSPAPREVLRHRLQLPAGSTLAQALAQSPWFSQGLPEGLAVGVWGRVRSADTPLCEGDRVEIYRKLLADPKEARRLRYKAAGARLVSRHRPLGPRR